MVDSEARGRRMILRAGGVAMEDTQDPNFSELGKLVSWAEPTLEQNAERVASIVKAVSVRQPPPVWENEMKRLVSLTQKEIERLDGLAEEQEAQGLAVQAAHRLYRLQHARETTRVLAPADSESDAQTVWNAPPDGTAGRKVHGREERGVIEVVESRKIFRSGDAEVWLRLRPLPGDGARQCWLKREGPHSSWMLAPREDASELQAGFFLEVRFNPILIRF